MEKTEVAKSAAKEQGYLDFKLEQLDVVETFVKRTGVSVVVPTSFVKSLATCSIAELCKLLLSIYLWIWSLSQQLQCMPEGRRCI